MQITLADTSFGKISGDGTNIKDFATLRFRYSDQKGPDINVHNKEYFDNYSSYTFLL